MKAAVYKRYGGAEVVSIAETAAPSAKDGELLIQVHASTVNRTDAGFRSAQYFVSRFFSGLVYPRNQVLGCEFSGVVVNIGAGVKSFKPGDRVFGYDDQRFGSHAEYKVIQENKAVVLMPEKLNFQTAAAMTEGSHYALGNIRAAKVKANDRVLVYGASGAIGSAAVQLLKQIGAYVVAVSNSKNVPLIKSLGADLVVDFETEDFTAITHRFDFVFDAVGKSSFRQCRHLMKPKGIYISTELGKNAENIWLAFITPMLRGKRVLFPIPSINKQDLLFLKSLAENGLFTPVIDRSYPLKDIIDAYRYVETGQKTGNVILNII
ncbi:NAD(P)-dependent alcohol dehydrogenase [Gynurincola endophyticus]|uniref:NAD(P)-dependent alcohol dehydrogenase n=1 Tax=Gynurincola endophyticus TaxID=2479004 RepID=UPI000F8F1B27|nr:NAD(P)-dependent alcohol dehydrogenase [Gynurincola endophyticus]